MKRSSDIHQLEVAINKTVDYLLSKQQPDGHWIFELEADCTISAEYILLMHFVNEIDHELQAKIANYLRNIQNPNGSYSLFTDGDGDLSATVKAYYALKLAGDSIDEPHMISAREYILSNGGAAQSNVFTRIMLASFEQVPWRAIPFMPVEVMLLPKSSPFHIDKIAYWSRCVMIPLLVICSLRITAKNPLGVKIEELFVTHPTKERGYFNHVNTSLGRMFLSLERIGFALEFLIPKFLREKAIDKAFDWMFRRANGEDGLGAIFPAMANYYILLDSFGYSKTCYFRSSAKNALKKLLVIKEDYAYCQPCLSPVWDTGLTCLALMEGDRPDTLEAVTRAKTWLVSKQLTDEAGDWQKHRPNAVGGGWAFQYNNSYYPDVDDSAVVGMVIKDSHPEAAKRAAKWISAMQSSNGGWGAFDIDNDREYLNYIPFADHGALLDPPSADVTARCVMFLSHMSSYDAAKCVQRGLRYLKDEQELDGSWFGRWGTNYIYGTWSVLMAFEAAEVAPWSPMVTDAVSWLKSIQNSDGGWGEDNYTYHDSSVDKRGRFRTSTAFHTALAIMAIVAHERPYSDEVRKGIDYLIRTQNAEGHWDDIHFNAPGFPKVFYLRYHGYSKFFPLWALEKYKRSIGNDTTFKL